LAITDSLAVKQILFVAPVSIILSEIASKNTSKTKSKPVSTCEGDFGVFAGCWHLFGALVNYKQPIFPFLFDFFTIIVFKNLF
jgi:hypothetical protein